MRDVFDTSCSLMQIGRVLKPDGVNGRLTISLHSVEMDGIKEPVYIINEGLPVPYFLSDVSGRGASRITANLTDVDSLDSALELSGKALYVKKDENAVSQDDFAGWILVDASQNKTIGTIEGIEPIPGNPCLDVVCDGDAHILVPLNEELTEYVDMDNRILRMNLPEGLLQILH